MNDNLDLKGLAISEIREMIKNGKLNITSLDTDVLQKLMDYETALLCFNEGDVDFISQCADVLSEKETGLMPHEEFVSVVKATLDKHTTKPKRFSLKRSLIIAATVATLVIVSTVVTAAMGVDPMLLALKALKLPVGTHIEIDGFTIEAGGTSRYYSSIEEMIESENLDIMYPVLPEGVEIDKIQVSAGGSFGDKYITILAKDSSICVCIITNVPPNELTYEGKDIYEKGDIKYIFLDGPTGYRYSAYGIVGNCSYDIQTKEYEDLIFIIENMEEN